MYSSAVMLCEASNCGVTATGSGTTTEEAVVITIAFIVARRLRWGRRLRPGHAWKNAGGFLKKATVVADQLIRSVRERGGGWGKGCAILFMDIPTPSRDGGTGRRSGLKIRRPQGHGGSTPPPGTIKSIT